jgi:Lysozyme like domain
VATRTTGQHLNVQSLWELIGQAGGNATALAIVLAESGGNTHARHVNSDGSVDRGLFQINDRAHPDVPDSCAYSPPCAASAAKKISKNWTDFSPWTTYTSGAYRRFLDQAKKGSPNATSGAFGTGIGNPTGLPNPLDATGAVGDFLNKLGIIFHGGFWLRVAMALGGLVLIALALGAAFKQFGKGLPAIPIPV